MKPERTEPTDPTPSSLVAADESPTAKVRRLRAVKTPYAWDPYEVWRTRVKPQSTDDLGERRK